MTSQAKTGTAPDLPSGEVAFLFTDIEGSTRLWERDSAAMWRALARHNAIIDHAVSKHGGYLYKTIGDAFQCAFPTGESAVAAAVEAQRGLHKETWPETGPIHVRMGLHIGEAAPLANGDYLAPCLNRLARLLATGHGGQVLITDALRARIGSNLPDSVTLLDLGRHRLRDLLEPERISQVTIAGLPDRFPALKSLERHPTNLPVQPTELVGRNSELAALHDLLDGTDSGAPRLVTLIGPGGTGKTRLALQVAADLLESYDDGVFLVDLAPLNDPEYVLQTIAQSLGVREGGGLNLREALIEYVRSKRLLLVLDNCEHLLSASRDIANLLGDCPTLFILATSRSPLRLRAEVEIAVEPLPVPNLRQLPSLPDLSVVPAVDLFVRRAASTRPDFALTDENARAVAEICARLDGLPLAIELAAARVKLLPPAALLRRLENQLNALTGGARDLPERQRALRTTIEWSHDLLAEDERTLFRRLAIFAGGAGIEAAEAVVCVDGDLEVFEGLTSLVDQSLLRQAGGPGGEPRVAMLQTIREFAVEQLEASGESASIGLAHAAYFLSLAEEATQYQSGPEHVAWLDRLEQDHDNFRTALAWFGRTDSRDMQAKLAGHLALFWHLRGNVTEGRRWLDEALAAAPLADRSAELDARYGSGLMAEDQGDYAVAIRHYEAGLALADALGADSRRISLLNNLGGIALETGNLATATARYEEILSLSLALGDRTRHATVLSNLGAVAHYRGDHDEARNRYEECLVLWRQLKDRYGQASMLCNLLVLAAPLPEESDRARSLGEEALALCRELGDREGIALALSGLGLTAETAGDHNEAIALHSEALTLFLEIGDASGVARAQGNLGLALFDSGKLDTAAQSCRESLTGFAALGDGDGTTYALESLAMIACAEGRHETAAHWLGVAEAQRETMGLPLPPEAHRRHARAMETLRENLTPEAFSAAWESGRSTSFDTVVEEAKITANSPLRQAEVPVGSASTVRSSSISANRPGTPG